jgi:spermidine/putrescine transport system permease protein
VLGLVYIYLPLMILPIYAALERINPELREASTRPGASPLRTFLHRDPAALERPASRPARSSSSCRASATSSCPSCSAAGGPDDRQPDPGPVPRARDWPFGAALASGPDRDHHRLLLLQAWLLMRERRREAGDADA